MALACTTVGDVRFLASEPARTDDPCLRVARFDRSDGAESCIRLKSHFQYSWSQPCAASSHRELGSNPRRDVGRADAEIGSRRPQTAWTGGARKSRRACAARAGGRRLLAAFVLSDPRTRSPGAHLIIAARRWI